jgi:hypothetical protein
MRRLVLVAAVALPLALAVTVWSATQPTGALKVPNGMVLQLKVAGKAVAVPPGRDMPMPAGKYQPAMLTCGVTDNARQTWTISATGPAWGKIDNIEVAEGKTTTLEAGAPFTLKTLMYQPENGPKGKVVSFTLRVYGKAGELYDLNTFTRGGVAAPNLNLQIVDEQGKVLSAGILPYG